MYDIALTHYLYAKRGRLEKWKTSNLELTFERKYFYDNN